MTDALQFNIRDAADQLLCPACGFPGFVAYPAYDERGGLPGSGICPCCLWEPGFDDNQYASAAAEDTISASLKAYRSKWAENFAWRGRASGKPNNWDPQRQLTALITIFPNV